MWREHITSLPIVLLFLAAWIVGGAALLWAGARFLASLPTVTFRRSLVVRGLHAAFASIVLTLARAVYSLLGAHPGFTDALAITGLILLGFWLIISKSFGTTLSGAIFAWLPMAGEVFVLFPLVLLLPDLPFWG